MKNVSREVIYRLPVPVPPLAEQHRIVAKVDELMQFCSDIEAHLASAAAIRRSLLGTTLREALVPSQ